MTRKQLEKKWSNADLQKMIELAQACADMTAQNVAQISGGLQTIPPGSEQETKLRKLLARAEREHASAERKLIPYLNEMRRRLENGADADASPTAED